MTLPAALGDRFYGAFTTDSSGNVCLRIILGNPGDFTIDGLGGVIVAQEFANGADPAAPSTGFRLYCVKTAGGKRQAAVRFPTGAPQIIATEP